MKAPASLPSSSAAVAAALARQRRSTYADLMAATGLPRSTLRYALVRLRAEGLVEWDEGKTGTIRATFGLVVR